MNNEKIKQLSNLRVAIVHDFLVQSGGAEKVLEAISEIFSEAPIYTFLYDKEKMRGSFKNKKIITSYLQKFPKFLRKRYQLLAPFFMVIPETWDLRGYDLVISSSGAWSKGIVTKLNTIHIAYIHSPMRYAWDYNNKYIKETKWAKGSFFVKLAMNYVRVWDRLAAERPDYLIANSKYTQKRIEKYYRRNSDVIYPPAYIENSKEILTDEKINTTLLPNKVVEKKYFLVVSRLSPYKKIDLVVETFNKIGLPLIIIGEGKQGEYLKKIANPNIKILGWKSDEDLKKYYANARAFIFPSEDDFGITVIEAMSFGLPVVAFRRGGALETVKEGISGEFFNAQTPEVLADSIRRFIENEGKYDKELIKKETAYFSKDKFKSEFLDYIHKTIIKN